jgi:hypothetical protein
MHRSTTWTDLEALMQNGTKRDMRTRRHGPTVGAYSDRSEGSKRKLSRPAGVGYTDAKGNYERYMALARTAGLTGDSTEIENYYQHAEHYLRLMKEQAV